MTIEYLCQSCDNKDTRFVCHGHEYKPEVACDYRMIAFPKAKKCDKYEPREHDDGLRPLGEPKGGALTLTTPLRADGYWCVVCGRFLPADEDGVIVHDNVPHPDEMAFDEEEKPQ